MRGHVSRRADDAEAVSPSELRAAIDGAYILEEWHIDDSVFRPPQVDGRVVFLNGAVLTILINKSHENQQITTTMFGVYQLKGRSFFYRYDSASIFTQTESAITVSHRLPWEGMRDFDIAQEGAAVRLHSRSSEHRELIFNAEGHRYSLGGKLLRVWRRSMS